MSEYAWIITTDYLAETLDMESEVGVIGPRDATEKQIADLKAGKGRTFTMYDDDGARYYKGRLVSVNGEMESATDDFCIAPLRDFGTPNAGAILIKWAGHPEWTAEYC